MPRELSRAQLIERTIIKTYRKELWNPFIQGVKNYCLVNDGDVILVKLENTAEAMLLAKLMQQLKRVSETKFELVFTGDEDCRKNAELLSVPLSEKAGNYNKTVSSETLSDICESLLFSILYDGKIAAPLPEENGVIRPLYCVSRTAVNKWVNLNNLTFDKKENGKKGDAPSILERLRKTNPEIEHNILNSLSSLCLDTMPGYIKDNIHHSFLENY